MIHRLFPSCSCTNAATMLRVGEVVCASCGAPLYVGESHPSVYSTATPASYPPGCTTRRGARERIRQVPDHERLGIGRATVWSVPAERYRAYHAAAAMKEAA